MAQRMPLPLTVSRCSKIQIGFSFLVLAHPCSPGRRAIKCVCVCEIVFLRLWVIVEKVIWLLQEIHFVYQLHKVSGVCESKAFYDASDCRALFCGENDFSLCLKESFPELKTRMLTRLQWCKIRRLMGKPRRYCHRRVIVVPENQADQKWMQEHVFIM